MAEDKPLLLFPQPIEADRDVIPSGHGGIRVPPHSRQGQRLNPQFNHLQRALGTRKMELQNSPSGAVFEQVLVLETAGGVDDFINAVKRISGMEWFGELDEDDIPPDDDFFCDEDHREKTLSGRMYLVMVNQQAIQQLLSLWSRYSQNENYQFPYGQSKWRELFKHLKNVRRWGIEDRIIETKVLENWEYSLQHGQQTVRFEAELWFRENPENRTRSQAEYSQIIQSEGGRIIASSVIPEIAYHGLLAEVPSEAVQRVVDHTFTELVRCDHIMYFRPVGQVSVNKPCYEDLSVGSHRADDLSTDQPIVALLDGFPLENHDLLRGRLIVDDCDNWSGECPANLRCHGTSMASLIAHGELDKNEDALKNPIYVRPVLKPVYDSTQSSHYEAIPDNELTVDLMHRAIKRIFEGESGLPPVAPSIKIINLSVGDHSRQFYNTMSPWARLLDWLAVKYNILFIVSAGNHPYNIELDIPCGRLSLASREDIEYSTLIAVAQDLRNRRLLSPAESINSLTIGALHEDASTILSNDRRINPYQSTCLPSPISSVGTGYRRSVKPEILTPGGRQCYDEYYGNGSLNSVIRINDGGLNPGQKVAYPGSQGETHSMRYTRGTSNSAALTTRLAAQLHDLLLELRGERNGQILKDNYLAVILKTLLVHGCCWGDAFNIFERVLKDPISNLSIFKEHVVRFLGYGRITPARLNSCEDHRATIIGCGELSDGSAHLYEIPLPPSLISKTLHRRLTVTLAWISPVAFRNRKYRKVSLWFSKPESELDISQRMNVNWQTVRRGTVQHELFEGNKASVFIDGDTLAIKVNCKKDASEFEGSIPYGIAVSLEAAERTEVPIYNEIRTRIRTMVRVTATSAEEE